MWIAPLPQGFGAGVSDFEGQPLPAGASNELHIDYLGE